MRAQENLSAALRLFSRKPIKNTVILKGAFMVNQMVLSSEIEWIGYENKTQMLQVEFIAGGIYQYERVPESVYQSFLSADSHGRFFESHVKGRFQYRKVRA